MTSSNTPDYPDYKFVPATITANGETLAKQYRDKDGSIVTDISMSKENLDRKNKLQNLLKQYEDAINVFSPEMNTRIESIANSRKQAALNDFNSMYEPVLRNSREDYFARLGTLDSTAYVDRYNQLEKTRQQAYADIANDYQANLQELKNNELNQRYNYLNYLQNAYGSLSNGNYNYLNPVSSISSSYTNNYNNYLNNLYNAQLNRSNANNNYMNNFATQIARYWSGV